VAGCGTATIPVSSTTSTTPAPVAVASPAPAPLHGAQAQAAHAVDVFDQALQSGDIAQLCRPGGVFTAEVVAALNSGDGCEASLEQSSVLDTPPTLIVTGLTYKGDLATAQVDGGDGTAIPLDLVRDGGRWLVSFSNGVDPITALEQ
jgi:hypothetical protein